ncbi:hypothetical protein LEP1GSC126_4008 [Leptospira kirschneri str. 200801774]|nr:hypothetical protein LEP1GSC126_4008 [Leptospira kirschneri str. 200801774]
MKWLEITYIKDSEYRLVNTTCPALKGFNSFIKKEETTVFVLYAEIRLQRKTLLPENFTGFVSTIARQSIRKSN